MYLRQNEVIITSTEHLKEVWKTGRWYLAEIDNDRVIATDKRPDIERSPGDYWFNCPLDVFLQLPQTGTVTGLIFHVSRCGSTLCRNLLDVPDGQTCLNEPDLVANAILNNDPDIRLFFSRMSGKVIIKTNSWNVMKIDWLRQQFPESKTIFIYRDPLEVLASISRNPNRWNHMSRVLNLFDVDECDPLIRFALCLEQMMTKIPETDMIIPYSDISKQAIYGRLPELLDYSVNEEQMLSVSKINSKNTDTQFVDDTTIKRHLGERLRIPPEIINKLTQLHMEIYHDISHSK